MYEGYIQCLKEKGYSEQTIDGYIKTLDLFFRFLNIKYKKNKELFQISSKDIKDFMTECINQGNSISTVNKHLAILKGYFHYLWAIEKVPIDPVMKIQRLKDDKQKPVQISYENLLSILPKVLNNDDYSVLRKVIFILSLKGLRSSEFQIKKENVIDLGNRVNIILKKHTLTLEDIEAAFFLQYYFESLFHDSDYVFVTKKHKKNKNDVPELVPIETMSIYTHLNAISIDYQLPTKLSLNDIRHAYVYYLYTKQKYSIEMIANTLGIQNESAANLVKESFQRLNKNP